MQYGYNKDTDYKKLMDDAASKGNYAQAAIYEQMRNEKIAGEGLNQWAQTNQYANYLQGAGANTGWKNPYQEELDAAIKRLQENSGGAYKWDPENDTAMQEYRKTYLREGDRTMRDTLGAYAKQTGGLASTQAIAAASQAADNYKAQLADKVPELEQQAYNRWYNEQQTARQDQYNYLSALMNAGSAAQSDYSLRINEALNRWQQLGYADDQVSSVLGVGVGTPTTDQSYQNWQKMQAQQDADWQREQWRYQQELDKYTQNEQQRQNAYNLAMTMLQLGQMPSAEMLAQAGISGEDAKRILAGVQAQSSGYSGGSGGSSGGGSYSSGGGSGSGSGSGSGVTGGVDGETPTLTDDSQLSPLGRRFLQDITASQRYGKSREDIAKARESLMRQILQAVESGYSINGEDPQYLTEAEANYLSAKWGIY